MMAVTDRGYRCVGTTLRFWILIYFYVGYGFSGNRYSNRFATCGDCQYKPVRWLFLTLERGFLQSNRL